MKAQMKGLRQEVKEVTLAVVAQYPAWYIPPYKEPAVDTNEKYEKKDRSYQEALDKVYGGTVTTLSHYVNNHCSMSYKCNSCGLVFFGKAGSMISDKEYKRHECGKVYGTVYGERYLSASSIKPRKNAKNLSKQREQQFYELVWEDYTPQEIASKLKVNPNIIKQYFVSEGLIEDK